MIDSLSLKTKIEERFIVVFLLLFFPNVTFAIEHSSYIRFLFSEEKYPLYQRGIKIPQYRLEFGNFALIIFRLLRQIFDWLPQLPRWDEDPS